MSQPFAFALVLGWGTPAGVVALGVCSALDRVRQGVGLRAWVSHMLVGMAPVVTVVAQTSLGLVPILGLTTAAVYLACRGAIRADRERARAAAADQARLFEGEQALIRQLQESDRLKRDLLATVSHELKTPLTVILGTLGTLSRRGAALDPAERREFVDMSTRPPWPVTPWPRPGTRTASCSPPTPRRPATAPASSSACP